MILWADFPTNSQGVYGSEHARLLNGLYAQANGSLVNDPDPTIGALGRVWSIGQGSNRYLRRVFGGTYATMGLAFRLWLGNLPVSNNVAPLFGLTNTANVTHAQMRVNPDGSLIVFKYEGDTQIELAATPGPVVVANAWQHIEWKYFDAVAGSFEIRIDGDTVLEFAGNTQVTNGGLTQFELTSNGAPTQVYLKDIVAWNGLGGVANDFIGPCSVFYLQPDADVSSGWSRTGGVTDWDILANVPPVDAEYIFAGEGPIPAPSIVGCVSLPPDIVAIRAVLPIVRARKSDGGEGKLQMSLVSDGDEDPGTDRPISTAFTYWWDVSHTDPATLTAWAPGAVDAVALKINRTL